MVVHTFSLFNGGGKIFKNENYASVWSTKFLKLTELTIFKLGNI